LKPEGGLFLAFLADAARAGSIRLLLALLLCHTVLTRTGPAAVPHDQQQLHVLLHTHIQSAYHTVSASSEPQIKLQAAPFM
jgi:hypothetical protein